MTKLDRKVIRLKNIAFKAYEEGVEDVCNKFIHLIDKANTVDEIMYTLYLYYENFSQFKELEYYINQIGLDLLNKYNMYYNQKCFKGKAILKKTNLIVTGRKGDPKNVLAPLEIYAIDSQGVVAGASLLSLYGKSVITATNVTYISASDESCVYATWCKSVNFKDLSSGSVCEVDEIHYTASHVKKSSDIETHYTIKHYQKMK